MRTLRQAALLLSTANADGLATIAAALGFHGEPIVLDDEDRASLGLAGLVSAGVTAWAAIVTTVNLLWWLYIYMSLEMSPRYALLHPLGAAALLYISVRAIARGRQVRWKGRDYQVA